MVVNLVDNQHLENAFQFIYACCDRFDSSDTEVRRKCYYQAEGCIKILETLDLLPTSKKIAFLGELENFKF